MTTTTSTMATMDKKREDQEIEASSCSRYNNRVITELLRHYQLIIVIKSVFESNGCHYLASCVWTRKESP